MSVTTGAVAAPACARHCGRSACAAWCRSTATTSRTYPRQAGRARRRRNIATGISGISTPNAAAPDCKQNRRDIARLLWRLWSPNWQFDDATFEATAASFDNPDFVDVTIQSYRHRYGNAPGDPALEPLEQRLAEQSVDHRADDRAAWCLRRGRSAGAVREPRAAFHRRAMNGAWFRSPAISCRAKRRMRWCRQCATCLPSGCAQRAGGSA